MIVVTSMGESDKAVRVTTTILSIVMKSRHTFTTFPKASALLACQDGMAHTTIFWPVILLART
jgi:hypothetical protein